MTMSANKIAISLGTEHTDILDELVSSGKAANRSHAVRLCVDAMGGTKGMILNYLGQKLTLEEDATETTGVITLPKNTIKIVVTEKGTVEQV